MFAVQAHEGHAGLQATEALENKLVSGGSGGGGGSCGGSCGTCFLAIASPMLWNASITGRIVAVIEIFCWSVVW